jgi:hypothetical protein
LPRAARASHFHVVALDGVFSEGDDGSVTFHEAAYLTADDVLHLERTLQRRMLRLFQHRRWRRGGAVAAAALRGDEWWRAFIPTPSSSGGAARDC